MPVFRNGIGNWGRGGTAPPAPFTADGPAINFGDSITSFSYQSDPARWGVPLTLYPPRFPGNYGVPNDTLQDMLNRQSTAISAAQGWGCTWVLLRAGTNGPGGGDFSTKYAQLVDNFVNAGLNVVCCQIPPGSSGGTTKQTYNAAIQSICAARPLTTLWVPDGTNAADGTYTELSGMTVDGIHPSPLGAYTIGKLQATYLDDRMSVDPRVVDSTGAAAQWLTNPLMSGTSGTKSGGTGTVPSSWSVSSFGAGTAFAASIVAADGADPVQVPWMRIELTTCGGANHSWEARADLVHPAINADFLAYDTVDCIAEVRFVGLNCTNLTSISVGPDSSRTYIQPAPRTQLTGVGTNVNERLVLRSAYKRSAATAYSANTLKLLINIVASGAFASSAGYIDIRCASAVGHKY